MTTVHTPISRGSAPHRLSLILLTLLVLLVAAGVVLIARHDSTTFTGAQGSGTRATQSRTVPAFTGVELAGSNVVAVHVGGKQTVAVSGDDNLLDRVTTQVRNGNLVIDNHGSFRTSAPMSIEVTVPTLAALTLSGSGTVVVDGVRGSSLMVRAPGSGAITVSGAVDRLDANLSGSGDLQLRGLTARDVEATVSGTGKLEVDATGTLEATVSGTGAIFYSGNPASVTRSVTGTGAILAQ